MPCVCTRGEGGGKGREKKRGEWRGETATTRGRESERRGSGNKSPGGERDGPARPPPWASGWRPHPTPSALRPRSLSIFSPQNPPSPLVSCHTDDPGSAGRARLQEPGPARSPEQRPGAAGETPGRPCRAGRPAPGPPPGRSERPDAGGGRAGLGALRGTRGRGGRAGEGEGRARGRGRVRRAGETEGSLGKDGGGGICADRPSV